MKEIINTIIEDLILYNGKSILIPLFILALINLWFTEKSKKRRIILVYLVTAIFMVFCCPFYAWAGMKVDKEIYYRVLWSLPMGTIICYSCVKVMMYFKSVLAKGIVFALALLVICINGKSVYTNTLHFRSVNEYHIPQVVIDVADRLKLDNYNPIAVMPAELLPFFRQYSANIFTPYGRNILEKQWNFNSELYDAMEADSNVYNAKEIARCARNENCLYVVLSCMKQIEGSMEAEDYFLLDFVQGYYIYVDYYRYDILKEQNLLDEDVLMAGEANRN